MKLPSTKLLGRFAHSKLYKGRHLNPLNTDEHQECTCMNCNTVFKGNYCPNCGQSSSTGRLTMMQAIDNLLGLYLNLDKGLLHTCIDLFYRPGYMMRDYIKGHRVEYVKPIQLLFLLATLYLALHYVLFLGRTDSKAVELSDDDKVELQQTAEAINAEGIKVNFDILSDEAADTTSVADGSHHDTKIRLGRDELQERYPVVYDIIMGVADNKAVGALILVIFMVFPYRMCFRKTPMGQLINSTECFFMMVYVECQQLMFNIVMLPFERFINNNDEPLAFGLPLLLLLWDSKQFFGITWGRSLKLNILSFMLAVAFFIVVAVCCGLIIETVWN